MNDVRSITEVPSRLLENQASQTRQLGPRFKQSNPSKHLRSRCVSKFGAAFSSRICYLYEWPTRAEVLHIVLVDEGIIRIAQSYRLSGISGENVSRIRDFDRLNRDRLGTSITELAKECEASASLAQSLDHVSALALS